MFTQLNFSSLGEMGRLKGPRDGCFSFSRSVRLWLKKKKVTDKEETLTFYWEFFSRSLVPFLSSFPPLLHLLYLVDFLYCTIFSHPFVFFSVKMLVFTMGITVNILNL